MNFQDILYYLLFTPPPPAGDRVNEIHKPLPLAYRVGNIHTNSSSGPIQNSFVDPEEFKTANALAKASSSLDTCER